MVDTDYMTSDRRAPSRWRRRVNQALFPPAIDTAYAVERAVSRARRAPLATLATLGAIALLLAGGLGRRR